VLAVAADDTAAGHTHFNRLTGRYRIAKHTAGLS
jgi:hypothetical protein